MVAKTDTTIYKGHRNWYIAGFIVALILLATTAYIAHTQPLGGWEKQLFQTINNWPSSWHRFFAACSITPESGWILAGAVVISFAFRMWRLTWRLAVSGVAGYVLTEALKIWVDRPRPAGVLTHIHQRWIESGNGFPSGHVMIVSIIMLSLLPYLPAKWRVIVPLAIGLEALSRIYLGAHLPLDVVGGFAAGLLVVSFVRILPQTLKVSLRLD